ncbi:MAG TPA: nucleotide pyrophosphatase, partial [Candidatus Latescibacteria bacterium]|nr:nucleotide pyrophosphatase [Candidatus Latescibacterota bacterium]
LGTTLPAESPVAWSSFQTGCNPGKHRIFDFLVPDRRVMRPQLCSRIGSPGRVLRLGKYRIPLGKPRSSSGRRSKPFWQILGEYGVFSSILRVPLTFPPEPFDGVLLAGTCLPDLKGSQGTYFYYTSDPRERDRELTSGVQLPLQLTKGGARGSLSGPDNPLVENGQRELTVDFELHLAGSPAGAAELSIGRRRWLLRLGEYSPWIRLVFKPGLGIKLRGLCRFLLLEAHPHLRLYITPLQLDPERPALPISHPSIYSTYLAKSRDVFATLGVAEDTSALNEGVIDEDAFLSQCQLIHEEREQMFFDALNKTPRGAVVCVFDITDRVQHMFLRCMDGDRHPANRGREWQRHRHVVRDLYCQMDELLGRVLDRIGDDELLMVMSDHGFKQFRRGVNLNTWLRRKG